MDPFASGSDAPPAWTLLDRRRLLGSLALGAGATAVAAGCTPPRRPGRTSAPEPVEPVPQSPGAAALGDGADGLQLVGDATINRRAMRAIGATGSAAVAGQVATALDQAASREGGTTLQSYVDAFVALGNRLTDQAVEARRGRHRLTARNRFMRAAGAYSQALYFVLGTDDPGAEVALYRAMDDAWRNAAWLMPTKFEPVEIPYGTSTLPGWFLPVDTAVSPRSTLVITNSNDGQHVDVWTWGAAAALERGYNVVLVDGPGQGEMLIERGVPLRPDWERVVTPVVDWLVERGDVDDERIVLLGWGDGAALAARAAASEPRLAALVCDPGVVDPWQSFPAPLREVATSGTPDQVNATWNSVVVPAATPMQRFALTKQLAPYSAEAQRDARAGRVPSDWAGLAAAIQRFEVSAAVPRIEVPTLVIDYELDEVVPGQANAVYDLLTAEDRELITLGVADGAMFNRAPLAPQVRNETIFDWLQDLWREEREGSS
jgi:pimeloyl-ACP methyl ester carboxylesterase